MTEQNSRWVRWWRLTADQISRFAPIILVALLVAVWIARGPDHDMEPAIEGMPAKVLGDRERELYFEPGGRYTAADIAANGHETPSVRYADFRASHDFDPQPGDLLCPVTRTKANPDCWWIIGGVRYEFCCPPCIDEYVQLAKERPEDLQDPEAFRH